MRFLFLIHFRQHWPSSTSEAYLVQPGSGGHLMLAQLEMVCLHSGQQALPSGWKWAHCLLTGQTLLPLLVVGSSCWLVFWLGETAQQMQHRMRTETQLGVAQDCHIRQQYPSYPSTRDKTLVIARNSLLLRTWHAYSSLVRALSHARTHARTRARTHARTHAHPCTAQCTVLYMGWTVTSLVSIVTDPLNQYRFS